MPCYSRRVSCSLKLRKATEQSAALLRPDAAFLHCSIKGDLSLLMMTPSAGKLHFALLWFHVGEQNQLTGQPASIVNGTLVWCGGCREKCCHLEGCDGRAGQQSITSKCSWVRQRALRRNRHVTDVEQLLS